MKMISCVVSVLGILAVVLGIGEWLFSVQVFHLTPAGYVRGATALFLMALVIMAYGRCYCTKCDKAPETKP
jgi:hypothetical protein